MLVVNRPARLLLNRSQACRRFSSSSSSSSSKLPLFLGVAAVTGGITYFTFRKSEAPTATVVQKPSVDYGAVAKDVSDALTNDSDYDGIGHYGPILVRLAWHASGSYDATTKTGGSNGATMRFSPEKDFGANAGLGVARSLLEPIKKKYGEQLSYADLWTLAGVVAIKEMGGPSIPWRSGRSDAPNGEACPPDGRLPDASKDSKHLRAIFNRMGFNDQEIVALSGAHALGKCHTDRSGYSGPWTFSPTSFTNAYFTLLLSETWVPKKSDIVASKTVPWKGPLQYTDKKTQTLMMLPTDMELVQDPEFRKWTEIYAKDQDKFFSDFSKVFGKLMELGVADRLSATTFQF